MNELFQTSTERPAPEFTQAQRVLRNTYWLLAISIVPTVFGAWLGITAQMTTVMSRGPTAIVFLLGAIGFVFAIEKAKDSVLAVPLLLAFTFFMGLMLSHTISAVLGRPDGAGLVTTAAAGAGAIFFGMALLSTWAKRDLNATGRFLFVGVVMLLVAGVANAFLQSSALALTLSVVAMGVFSAFILYDLKRVRDGDETNYISATLSVYLSLFNVFSSLLDVLGLIGREG
ncbi:modulator of FtsH protease [Variovorax boronicumulans]|uniref:Bax inhibitor-1 family protein n=1 Tax=Variovorax boronicumulans TaxID=436515 RepID=UPI002473EB2E|nr:Bax inhibitor-1 family protein [Variovorax boronicumulans]MDH6170926.1 modulator of FtsH protease [Variovorax boronicumulans]